MLPPWPSCFRRGFSLIEVVIAMAITVFAVLSILGLLGGAMQTNRDSEQRIEAANLATALIARYRDALNGETDRQGWPSSFFAFPRNGGIAEVPPGGRPPAFSAPEGITAQGGQAPVAADNAAFVLRYAIWSSSDTTGMLSPYRLVNCALRFQWPPAALRGGGKVDHYEVTTAFLVKR